ncbi:hypothetical protein HHI36_017063, partial [Cryptolaemus montrouzieri]
RVEVAGRHVYDLYTAIPIYHYSTRLSIQYELKEQLAVFYDQCYFVNDVLEEDYKDATNV